MRPPRVLVLLSLALLLDACAAAPAPTGATSSPGATAPVRPLAADDVFAAIKARDVATLDALLDRDPRLARARRADGTSTVLVALFSLNPDGETFVPPQTNPCLRALLERHPPLDVFDAAAAGDLQRVRELVEASPDSVRLFHPKTGGTPLHLAAFAGRNDVVLYLLAKGAAVDERARSRFHNTALVQACLTAQRTVAETLLARGADPNAAEEGGFRALHIAAENGDLATIDLLLDRGADASARADDGTTPRTVARQKKHPDAERRIADRGGHE